MSQLRELYQSMIIDHGRSPRNFGALPEANRKHEGFNPLCGDKIILHVLENNGVLEKLAFEGSGCAISMASASLMTECLQGKSIQEIEKFFHAFHELVTQGKPSENLGKLAVLGGVAEFPVRVKCATLAWHTLKAALGLSNDPGVVTTEKE